MQPTITILFGGTSDERLVSVASAQNLAESIPDAKLCFENFWGEFFHVKREHLLGHGKPFEVEFVPESQAFARTLDEALEKEDWRKTVFLLALHGGSGEDGTHQAAFEKRHIAFTGSGAKASANSFNKVVAKKIAKDAGLRVLPEKEFQANIEDINVREIELFFRTHGELILKPTSGGSSIGLFRVRSTTDIRPVAKSLTQFHADYLMEPFLKGREITVGVYEEPSRRAHALPPSEVVIEGSTFDYDGKYLGKGSQEITPANLTPEDRDRCQSASLQAHQALHAFGYSRTDVILTADGPVYLETNTLPGLTKRSFIPQQLTAAGVSLTDFLNGQIQLGWKRAHS